MPLSRTKLFVKNLSTRVVHDDLRHAFEKFGPIMEISIPLDYYTRRVKGYGFVEYENPSDAKDAQRRMNGSHFMGRDIEIEFANGVKRTAEEMAKISRSNGGGGGGGRGGGRGGGNFDRRGRSPYGGGGRRGFSPRGRSPPRRRDSRGSPPPKRRYTPSRSRSRS